MKNVKSISILTYLTIIIVFIANIMIVRELEVDSYGVFAFLLAIISIVEAPMISRGSELYLKNIGEYWHNGEYGKAVQNTKYLINMEIRVYFSVFLAFILLSILIFQFKDIDPIYLIVLALSIPFQIGYSVYKSHLTLVNEVFMLSIMEIIFAIFYLILIYVMVSIYGLIGLVLAISSSALIKTLISRFVFIKMLKKKNIDYHSIYAKKSIINYKKRSLNSIYRNFTQSGIVQIDLIILGIFGQPTMVAFYKIAKTLAGLPLKVAIPIWKILYPDLVKSISTNNAQLKRTTIHKGMLATSIMLIVIIIFSYFYGEQLIALIYGNDYVHAYIPFLILIVGYGLFFAINGWFKIWVALIEKISIGSYFYTSTFILVSISILIFKDNIVNMALGVTFILSLMTFFAYLLGRKYE
jgi:O-antigen/teichoic acid export membrane protein